MRKTLVHGKGNFVLAALRCIESGASFEIQFIGWRKRLVFRRLCEVIDGDTPEAPGLVDKLAWMVSMFWLGTLQTLVDSGREKEMRVYCEEPDNNVGSLVFVIMADQEKSSSTLH